MKALLKKNGAWLALLILALVIGVLTKGDLFSSRNITNLVRQVSINGVLACGMTVVILTGGIDLSIGSIVALAGIIVGISQFFWQWSAWQGLGAVASTGIGLAVGLLVGTVNGALISFLGIAPFVITLGMMVIARGLSLIFSGGSGISPMGDSLLHMAQSYVPLPMTVVLLCALAGYVLWAGRKEKKHLIFPLIGVIILAYSFLLYRGFPRIAVFLLGTMFLTHLLLDKTPWGRGIYAIGSNEQAALWAGVPVRKIKWTVYILMGLFSGLAAVLVTARQNGASPTAGELAELDAIAAVVIGGTSLRGGRGTVVGSVLGAFIIGLLNNGMDLLEVPSFYQMVFKGVIIIIAVSLDRIQEK